MSRLFGIPSLSLSSLTWNQERTPAMWDCCEYQMKNNYKRTLGTCVLSVRYYYAKQLLQVLNAKAYIINIAEKQGDY